MAVDPVAGKRKKERLLAPVTQRDLDRWGIFKITQRATSVVLSTVRLNVTAMI